MRNTDKVEGLGEYYDRIEVPVTLYPEGGEPYQATAWVYKMTNERVREEEALTQEVEYSNESYVK